MVPGERISREGLLPAGEHVIRVAFRDTKGRLFDATESIRIIAHVGG